MPHAKPHLTTNQIALLAVGISVLSSGFSIYQWWDSGRQDRTRAAIDLSNKYVEQRVDSALLRRKWDSGVGEVDLTPVQNQDPRLAYIAFLTNRGYVNPDYLSQRLLCDIAQSQGSEEKAFIKEHPKACVAPAKPDSDETPSAASRQN